MKSLHVLSIAGLCAILLFTPGAPLRAQTADVLIEPGIDGTVHQVDAIDPRAAEVVFASAEAAIYFPNLQRVRWFESRSAERTASAEMESLELATATLEEFRAQLVRDFPGFELNTHGPYVLKLPARSELLVSDAMPVTPAATVLSDSFENGISQWTLANNTNGDYDFTAMGCAKRTGAWSADAVRGGNKGQYMFCSDGYPASVTTQITHANCDAIQGASQAWLDFYLTAEMDSTERIGAYYLASDGYIWGYQFSGNWTGWFHVILNLKQWNHVADLTAVSCPKLIFQFKSDATATVGSGPQLDDVTIRTDAPPFLSCSINATPSTGAAPLSVSFSPGVTGSAGSETYEWQFGDAAGTTSTSRTPNFTYDEAGQYWARLRVIDADKARAYAYVNIVVTPAAACSVACTTTVPATGLLGTPVSFQSTANATGCSGNPAYLWNFGDGKTSTQQNASHTYVAYGTYSWTLTVSAGGANCTKNGTLTVSSAGTNKIRRRSVTRPADPSSYSVNVSPSSSPQTFSFGGVSVTLPGGTLASSQTLTIRQLSNAAPPNYKGLQQMAAYDIRLGDLHTFKTPLTIRLKYDPKALRTDLPAERVVSASYWDPEQSAWVTLPSTLDTAKSEVVVTARHLSLFSWSMVKLGYSVFFKNHFYIVYDKAEVTDPNFLQWYKNPDTSNYADINVPNYIEDVMAFLIDAWRDYVDDGKFTAPPAPVDVYVGTDIDSFTDKITGIVLISLLPKTPEQLKMVTAHELFHRVQNAYYYDLGGMLWLKWWLESTAEYSGEHVVWPGINQMGKKIARNYLETPLTDAGDAHDNGYSTSHFIKHLVDNGANFKKMWDATANPDWFDSFAFTDGLSTYLMTVHGTSQGLNRQYQRFARYFVFDASSPMPAITDTLHSEVAAYRTTVSDDDGESKFFSVRGGYTAKLWGIWFSDTVFTSSSKLRYRLYADDVLGSNVEADVYLLKGDKRVAGGGMPAGTLTASVKSVEVEVEKGDAVYVLAVNMDRSDHQFAVKIAPVISAAVAEVCFDGNVTIRTVESQMTTDKRITRCVKEGDLNSSIGVSAISSQWITVTAQETYTDGTWFKITVSQLPISDQAMKRYRATGAAAEKHVPVLEYQYKDCSGGYCETAKLKSVDWPSVSVWVTGK